MRSAIPLSFRDAPNGETLQLPAPAVKCWFAVTLIPIHTELTTQEAANMLNISHPSLIQLLDEGKIEYRKVGTHRRVRFEALMMYKRRADDERHAALAELAAYDQELGWN